MLKERRPISTLMEAVKVGVAAVIRHELDRERRGGPPTTQSELRQVVSRAFADAGCLSRKVMEPWVRAAYFGVRAEAFRQMAKLLAESRRRDRPARFSGIGR